MPKWTSEMITHNYAFHWTNDAVHKFCEIAKLAPSITGQ